jgi:hypothetical protein
MAAGEDLWVMNRREVNLSAVSLTHQQVFAGSGAADPFIAISDWPHPVQYFVGRNGSGKSRTAKLIAGALAGRFLSTDRLVGLMNFTNYEFGAVPAEYRGVPTARRDRDFMQRESTDAGGATAELAALREQPEVALRVAAFIKRALGRLIELREVSGFLDPYVSLDGVEYSLLRDEGHGLRELVVLLAAAYRQEWDLLVVDEPELHLHPAMARLWLAELNKECAASGRRAIVVTHEPTTLRPRNRHDLSAIWLFSNGRPPVCVGDAVLDVQEERVAASLKENPSLMSALAFSPRPVLVEGVTDVAALAVALERTQAPEVTAQTDLVECGGSGKVGLWLEICRKLRLDVKAVGDLDAVFAGEVQRVMDADETVVEAYKTIFYADPPTTGTVLRSLIQEANKQGIPADPKSRAIWLSGLVGNVHAEKRDRLLAIWRDAGLWLHPAGTLEDALAMRPQDKGAPQAAAAAQSTGNLDDVARWCAYELDPHGDLEHLLNVVVEQLAHSVMTFERSNPGVPYRMPAGEQGAALSRLAEVESLEGGRSRITLKAPRKFQGYWLEFSRESATSELELHPPVGGIATVEA